MNSSIFKKINSIFTVELNTGKYKAMVFENIATMLSAGIDIQSILKSLNQEAKSNNIKNIIDRLTARVENGDQLWKIFDEERFVGSHLIALIRIGEQTGSLPKNLDLVVKYKQRENEFTNKIRSASLYPGFILILLILVAAVMLGFVLPRLTSIYESFKVDLPVITKIMIALGNFFRDYGAIAIPISIVVIFIGVYVLFFNRNTKYLGDSILFKVPVIKNLLIETETSRFGYLMSNLLSCGINVPDSLRLLANATNFRNYRSLYNEIAALIEKGYSFNEIFFTNKSIKKLIPLYARELVVIGEKTGKLPENLQMIGETFEKRNETSLKDTSVIFEPVLLVMVWGGIAFVAIAVILPLYNIIGNISGLTSGIEQQSSVEQTPTENVINDPSLLDATPSENIEETIDNSTTNQVEEVTFE